MCVRVCLCVWAPQTWKHQTSSPPDREWCSVPTMAASQHQCFPKTLGKQSLFAMRFLFPLVCQYLFELHPVNEVNTKGQ